MGPRNRRRLAIGGGLAAATVAIVVAAVLLTRPATPSRHGVSTQLKQIGVVASTYPDHTIVDYRPAGITIGMTHDQLLRSIGKPTTKQGRCWQYQQPVTQDEAAKGVVKEDLDVCFYEGQVTDLQTSRYARRHGKLVLLPPEPGDR